VASGGGNPGGVWVIDGIALQKFDADPSTPVADMIILPYFQSPTALTIDPKGHYLYVAGTGAIFVIDINPGSPTLHRVVDTIPISTTTGKINDLAVNADGTRLYLTAPETELYGGTKSWVIGGRDTGNVLVVNVDEQDRPASATASNVNMWRKVIATLDGGLEPYGIKATSFADKMIFTSRLRGGPNSAFEGLQTIVVTNNSPTGFAATVNTIDLALSNNQNQKYQLYIRNPADVAILPDLSYAFVSDWNVPLSVGPGPRSALSRIRLDPTRRSLRPLHPSRFPLQTRLNCRPMGGSSTSSTSPREMCWCSTSRA
jgi:DNA-binding beta-propeller fold protein YncE